MRRSWLLLGVVAASWLCAPVEATASGGGGCGGPLTDRPGPEVNIMNFCFDPQVVRVSEGAEVSWTNLDGTTHNLYGGPIWGTNPMRESGRATFRFDRAGVFPYACTFHPGMTGVVVVGDGYSGAEIGGQKAGVESVSFARRGSTKTASVTSAVVTAEPAPMEAVGMHARPAVDVEGRASWAGPLVAGFVIAVLCAIALITGRAARRG